MKTTLILMTFLIMFNRAFAQVDYTPYPGNATYCSGNYYTYTASSNNNCGLFTWTITNGVIRENGGTSYTGENEIEIKWNDVTSIGKLKVSITCGSGESANSYSEEKSFVIRSLKGVVPQNIQSLATPLAACNTNTFDVLIDEVIVPNTGPFTSITAKYAEGYEWSVPAGWSKVVNGNRVTITPNNGCSTGNVKVRAYISSCGTADPATWFYSSWSEELPLRSISVPIVSASSQASYTLQCGDLPSIRINSTSYPNCGSATYTWVFPSGWRVVGSDPLNPVVSPVTTGNPYIDIVPRYSTSEYENSLKGSVQVTANLGCGNYQSNSDFQLKYNNPELANPIFTSSSTQLLCGLSSGTVAVNAIPNAATYTWYTYGPALKVNGVSATSASPVTTTSPSVTLSLNRSAGENDIVYVKAGRSNNCAGSPLKFRNLWLGKPKPVDAIAQGLDAAGPFYLCANQTYQFNAFDYNNFSPVTNYTWSVSPGHTIQSYNGSGNITANIKLGSTVANTFVSVYASNTCGLSATKTVTLYQSQVGCGSQMAFTVFPNPTTEYIEIEYTGEERDQVEYEILLTDDGGAEKVKIKTKEKKNRISTQELKKGVYSVKIKSQNIEQDYRIIKE